MRLCFAEMAKRYAGERVLETGLPGQVCRRKSAGNRGMPERECWKPGYAGERVLETARASVCMYAYVYGSKAGKGIGQVGELLRSC